MSEVEAALADAHRREWARVLAATARVARDLDLAEECVQDAYASAMTAWDRSGIPDNPGAWLTTAAKRRAIDAIRRDAALRSRLPLLVVDDEEKPVHPEERHVEKLTEAVPDERLRLIFVCCHPALAQEAQAALTLRLVCGLPVPDIARAFLVSEPTMAARITRAKKKIAVARIPYRVPRPADLPERLRAVLTVIHLLFTAGHTAPSGAALVRADLVDRATHLARMLCSLLPDDTEARGLLALLLVTDARRATRVDEDGRLLRLKDQDRSRWDRAALAEADAMIVSSLRAAPPGRYVLQAAIASLYAEAPAYDQTDWPQLVALYDKLLQAWPSPVVALNRTVPLSMVAGPEAALAEVERLEGDERLSGYQYLPAIKADLLSRLGRLAEADAAYRRAFDLAANEAERAFLAEQFADLAAGLAQSSAGEQGAGQHVREPLLVLARRPPSFGDQGVVGVRVGDRPHDVGGGRLGQAFFQRAFPGQGSGEALLVFVPGLLLLLVELGYFGVRAGGSGEDLVEAPDAVADLGCQGGEQGELPAGVGLMLDGLPLLSASQGAGVVVADDADGEQLVEDGALVSEDGVDGLDSHVCFLGDGGDGRGGIAVTDEEGLGGVQHAMAGGEGLAGPAARNGLDRLLHVSRVYL